MRKLSQRYFLVITFISSLIVLPGLVSEPQVLPKFTSFSLGILSLGMLGVLRGVLPLNRKLILFIFLVFILLALNLLTSEIGFAETLFGVYGRNNGVIMLTSILTLVLMTVALNSINFVSLLVRQLGYLNVAVLSYFFVQLVGLDPIAWVQIDKPASFLGNTNFLSAFLAISMLAYFSKSVFCTFKARILLKFSLVLMNFLALVLIGAIQGLLLFGLGVMVVLYIEYFQSESESRTKKSFIKFGTSIAIRIVALTFLIGGGVTLLSLFLSAESIRIRIHYWAIGIRAFFDKPLYGYGLDSYLYVFNEYRDKEFISQYGTSLVSSSSHNIFIDYFVGGGVLFGGLYLIVCIWITVKAISILQYTTSKISSNMKLFSISWILFVLQSIVSIQHPTLAIWQWISGALILSYKGKPSNKIQFHWLDSENNSKVAKVTLSIVLFFFLLLAPSSFFKDYDFAQAIRQRNGEALIDIALSFPSDTYKSNYSARALQDNGYWYWANKIAKESVISNPRNLEGWVIILENELSSRNEKREALVKIKALNLHQNSS